MSKIYAMVVEPELYESHGVEECFCGRIRSNKKLNYSLIVCDFYTESYIQYEGKLISAVCINCLWRLAEMLGNWEVVFVPRHVPDYLHSTLFHYIRVVNKGLPINDNYGANLFKE